MHLLFGSIVGRDSGYEFLILVIIIVVTTETIITVIVKSVVIIEALLSTIFTLLKDGGIVLVSRGVLLVIPFPSRFHFMQRSCRYFDYRQRHY